METVQHFGYYLYGRNFKVYTDHGPLCYLLSSEKLNGSLKCFSMKLQHWMPKIEYLPGQDNGMADALSKEERQTLETAAENGRQSGHGGCEGVTPTLEKREAKDSTGRKIT